MGVLKLAETVKLCAKIYNMLHIDFETVTSSLDQSNISIVKNKKSTSIVLFYSHSKKFEIRIEEYTSGNLTEFVNYINKDEGIRYRIGKCKPDSVRSSVSSYVRRGKAKKKMSAFFESVFTEEEYFQLSTVTYLGDVTFEEINSINEVDMTFRALIPERTDIVIDMPHDLFINELFDIEKINKKLNAMKDVLLA